MSERQDSSESPFPTTRGSFSSINNRRERTRAGLADAPEHQGDSTYNGLRNSMLNRNMRIQERKHQESQSSGSQQQRKKLVLLPRTVPQLPATATNQPAQGDQDAPDLANDGTRGAERSHLTDPSTPESTYPKLLRHGIQMLPKYYRVYRQKSNEGRSFGRGTSFWRALAKLHIGDFNRFACLKDKVMRQVIWMHCDGDHPSHDDYMNTAGSFRRETGMELFSVLECPDVVGLSKIFLELVAQQLNIAIRVYGSISKAGEPEDFEYAAGRSDAFCYLLLRSAGEGKCRSTWSSLEPDRSGKDLVEYLAYTESRVKDSGEVGLQMERITWYVSDDERKQVTCINGFRTSHVLPSPTNRLSQLVVFEMVISKSRHVSEAIRIMLAAAEHAPNHHRRVRLSGSDKWGVPKPYGSADMEFAKLPRALLEGRTPKEVQTLVDTGEVENFPSVLTYTVGGRAVAQFNILHMMEHADEETVSAMSMLLTEIIFNAGQVKYWWNYQQDIIAIHCLIAHLWQATPREAHDHTPYGAYTANRIEPTFKIRSKYFNGVRPEGFIFPNEPCECEVHESFKLNELGLACPCSTGNLDIAPMLTEFCRQQGRGGDMDKLPWFVARKRVKFDRMVSRLMKDDRRFAIFQRMKEVPEGSELQFYQTIGDLGAELDDQKIGYLTVDALLPALIVDELLSSDDPQLNAGILSGWLHAADNQDFTIIKRALPQRRSIFGASSGVMLFEDTPRSFRQPHDPVFGEQVWFATDESFAQPEALETWEHDRQVDLFRREVQQSYNASTLTTQKDYYEPLDDQTQQTIAEKKGHLLRLVTDTRKLRWQAVCANALPDDTTGMIVRGNMTNSEALVEHLLARPGTTPIPGLGATPGSPLGLPSYADRVPGWSLPGARQMFDAMARGQKMQSPSFHNGGRHFVTRVLIHEGQDMHPVSLMQAALVQLPRGSSDETAQDMMPRMKNWLQNKIKKEQEANAQHGLPSFVDVTDVFDPEGRNYRRRMEMAQDFQRRNMVHMPRIHEGEEWTSKATETMKMLEGVKL